MENVHNLNAIAALVATQHDQLEKLARAWLAAGAARFELLDQQGAVLFAWPLTPDAPNMPDGLLADVYVFGRVVGMLHVYGLDAARHPSLADRLRGDAGLLARLLQLEGELESMTVELIDAQDQILALYQLARSVRENLTIEETLQTLASEAAQLVKVDVAGLVMTPALQVQHPRDALDDSLIAPLFQRVLSEQREILLNDPEHLPPGIDNALLIPIWIRDMAQAALALINKPGGFTSPDMKLARAIAEEASAHVEKVLLYQATLAQARLKTELDLAANIQARLLPQQVPHVPGIQLFAVSIPAKQVGGDFYDFVYQPDHLLTVVVGDVAGKGFSSALLMAMTRTVMRSRAKSTPSPESGPIISLSNDDLYEDYTGVSVFTTVFVGRYDPHQRELSYANAGHSPVIYIPLGEAPRFLAAEDMPMGVLPGIDYQDQVLTLKPGDVLIVASDGLSEARNAEGDLFSYERLLALAADCTHYDADEIAHYLLNTIQLFSAGHEQDDDQTVLVLKVV